MRITIRHELVYAIGTHARVQAHVLLTPVPTAQQKIERWSVEMPGMAESATFRDGYGNRAHLVTATKIEGEIRVVVEGVVETSDRAGVIGRLDHDPMPALYRRPSAGAKAEPELIAGLEKKGGVSLLHELMARIHEAPAAASPSQSQTQDGESQSQGQSTGVPPPLPALRFIGAARALGLPARYVTGYVLETDDDPAGFRGWAEVWEEGLGWIGFDPVCNLCPVESHVRVATGFDIATTLPVRFVPSPTEMPHETASVTAD
jgi:hypothetical protein